MSEGQQGRDSQMTIDVSEKTKKRFERKKAAMDAADPNVPDMTDEHFVTTLLDTLEAAENGYYETAQEGTSE